MLPRSEYFDVFLFRRGLLDLCLPFQSLPKILVSEDRKAILDLGRRTYDLTVPGPYASNITRISAYRIEELSIVPHFNPKNP
jgi:hypothetical protein